LSTWGNSQGIRIPKTFLKDIHVSENDPVDIILSDEKIIIKKVKSIKLQKNGLWNFMERILIKNAPSRTKLIGARPLEKKEDILLEVLDIIIGFIEIENKDEK
jgi:antitoxin component of MazEF toxin-antitoxin module